MEHITIEMIVLALLGMLIHATLKALTRSKKGEKFSLKVWAQDQANWLRLFLAIASTGALLLMSDEIASYFNVQIAGHGDLMSVLAFVMGYFNHSLLSRILKIFSKKIEEPEKPE